MAYYPKSQIKTNLYTNGEEYLLSTTGKYYKGYFYEVSNGDRFTGKTPQDLPSILLTVSSEINKLPQDETSPNITLISGTPNYNSIVVEPRSIPIPNLTLPTSQDYKFGEFQRYFAKKNNELRYLEIDKQTYTLLQNRDTAIAWDLYTPITVTWELSGNKEKTYNINKNMVNLVERNNKWYGFTQWFKDKFLKYYLAS